MAYLQSTSVSNTLGPPTSIVSHTMEDTNTLSLTCAHASELSGAISNSTKAETNTATEYSNSRGKSNGSETTTNGSSIDGKRKLESIDDPEESLAYLKKSKVIEDSAAEPQTLSKELEADERGLTSDAGTLQAHEGHIDSEAPTGSTEPSYNVSTNDSIRDHRTPERTSDPNFKITENDDSSSGLSSPPSSSFGGSSVSFPPGCVISEASSMTSQQESVPSPADQLEVDPNDTYSRVKVSGRNRKRASLPDGFVDTTSVIKEEETVDSTLTTETGWGREETSPAIRKKAKPASKRSSQNRSAGLTVVRARQASKNDEDAKKQEKSLEDALLRNIRGATLSRVKKSKAKMETTTKASVKARPRANLSKAEEKAQLRELATTGALAKWTLRNTSRMYEARHIPQILTISLPEVNTELLALSRRLTKRESLEQKPEPQGGPEVWAESRQALCETVPYFKKPQGGSYTNEGHVYGFLFDSIGHCREYMDENVIICRAGGSMTADGSGAMVQKEDHTMDRAQAQAVLNDMVHHNPTVVICGNRNAAARCRMPHQYCVLGWYKPTLVWSERTVGKGGKVWTTIKYRLERLNSNIPAWHAPQECLVSEEQRASIGEVPSKTCDACYTQFPQIYLGGWMCLNDKCKRFWKFHGSIDAPYGNETSLSYHPAFLLHKSEVWSRSPDEPETEPAPLRPAVADIGNAIGDNLTYVNTRGICCPKCGRCNSRRLFKGWVCENKNCDFELSTMHRIVSPTMLHTPWDMAQTLVRNSKKPYVNIQVEHKFGYKISTYSFQGIRGCFIHASATKQVRQEQSGADDMFANIQTVDMGLERRTFAIQKMSGNTRDKGTANGSTKEAQKLLGSSEPPAPVAENTTPGPEPSEDGDDAESEPHEAKATFADGDLMTAFSMNYGMPYKFAASGASKPFEDGPWPVIETRRRLNWAAKAFLNKPEEDMDFNEELILAYLEGQKIEYHDDGEEGLGPRIATLSLGGKAKMHMRMKGKHYVGCSKTGILTEDKPLLGSLEYENRVEAWNDLQQLKNSEDTAAYAKRRKEIPKELGLYEKRMKKADDLVTVTLCHGDIVIMDGYEIQKFLEHKVVSEGYLRFALTCRTVLSNHLKPEEKPSYEVKVDEQTYDGPKV